MQRDPLRAEKQFSGTQHSRILHVIECIAQNHVQQLVHEQWRNVTNAVPHQRSERGFERFMPQQVITKIDQKPPVFARIRISDRRDVRSGDRQTWIGKQAGMQGLLDRTGIRRRQQFRTRKIKFKELVGNVQSTLSTTIEQMMTAGDPEIVHLRSRPAIEIKSTASPGCSSSPSTSRKEKARNGFGPLRGRSVRNDSRTAPSSNDR